MQVIKEIWFSDLETATFESQYFKKHHDTTVNIWTLMNLNGDKYFHGTDLKDYFSKIKNEIQKNVYIYFHNLSWDGDFILKWLSKNGFTAVNQCDFSKPFQFCFFRSLSKIYAIKVALPSGFKKPQIITFKCSYLLLNASINDLGNGLGLSKFENFDEKLYDLEPQKDINNYPKAYVNYAKRDTEIARRSFLNFSNEINNFLKKQPAHFKKFNWKDEYTIGAISYELQRLYLLKNYKFKYAYKISMDDYLIADNFYFGGFTQFNPKIQNETVKCKKGHSFDINSAHPFSMTKLLPISKLHNLKTEPIPKNKQVLEYLEIKVKRAYAIQDVLPCLINWPKVNKEFGVSFSNQRYSFQLDNFTCYYLKQEWELLQHFYKFEGIKIINHYWAFADYPLKQFTNDLYKFKIFHKKQKNKAMEHCYKILLNSAYGKHATRIKFGDFYICKDKDEWEQYQNEEILKFRKKDYEILHSHFTFDLPGVYALPILKVNDPKFLSNKLMAATITAWSRIYLLEGILKLGLKNFLYCDTDSVYVSNVEKNIKIKLDDYELGAWKQEQAEPFKYFYVQGSKCYVVANDAQLKEPVKATFSGISKKWLKRNYSPGIYGSFDAPLEKANLKRLSCPSGLVIVPIDYQPKPRSI